MKQIMNLKFLSLRKKWGELLENYSLQPTLLEFHLLLVTDINTLEIIVVYLWSPIFQAGNSMDSPMKHVTMLVAISQGEMLQKLLIIMLELVVQVCLQIRWKHGIKAKGRL